MAAAAEGPQANWSLSRQKQLGERLHRPGFRHYFSLLSTTPYIRGADGQPARNVPIKLQVRPLHRKMRPFKGLERFLSMAKAKRGPPAVEDGYALIPVERVARSILLIRGQKVLLDVDLAAMYGVPVKRLNQAVKRNLSRFPADFMFQLTRADSDAVSRSQFVTLNKHEVLRPKFATLKPGRGMNTKYLPYVFTEHGAVMLASVLRSPTAVSVSIQVVRAFVRLRQMIATNDKMRRKLAQIERKLQDHDRNFAAVFDAIRQLIDAGETEEREKSRIGYDTESKRQ